jgi:hypothetical protein
MIFFYRRLLQAAIILGLYNYPLAQVLLSMKLNMCNLIFILQFPVTQDPSERRREILNEVTVIFIIYFLMCFLGSFIANAEKREILGFAMIAVTLLNFLINILPIILKSRIYIKHYGRKYIRKCLCNKESKLASKHPLQEESKSS